MRCFFSWQSSCGPLHIRCLHSERISTYTFNWLIKPSWSEQSWYSDTDLAIEAPSPLSVPRVRRKALEMQNVPKHICSHSTDSLLRGNQKKPRPVCPQFDNNKEANDPATKGNTNVYMLDANKAIIKLRTSIWALLSNGTLLFTRNFREGWTSIRLISIMELILPSASEVSRRLSFLDNTLGVDGYLGRTLPFWRGSEGVWMMHLGWRSQHLCGGNSVRALCQYT